MLPGTFLHVYVCVGWMENALDAVSFSGKDKRKTLPKTKHSALKSRLRDIGGEG